MGERKVIGIVGQSNARLEYRASWKPATNLYVLTGEEVVPAPTDRQNFGLHLGDRIARDHPSTEIVVATAARGGAPISLWDNDAEMWAETCSTMSSACKIAGTDRLAGLAWFQGEADAALRNTNYARAFRDLYWRMTDQPWFGCPMLVMGISPHAGPPHLLFNRHILAPLASQSLSRRFVDLTEIGANGWWDDALHLTMEGQKQAADLAASAWREVCGRAVDVRGYLAEMDAALDETSATRAELEYANQTSRMWERETQELRRALIEVQAKKRDAEARWVEASQHAARLQQEIVAIRRSISFRLTAPLRWVRRMIRL